jgi:hypothetical protein
MICLLRYDDSDSVMGSLSRIQQETTKPGRTDQFGFLSASTIRRGSIHSSRLDRFFRL